MGAVTRWRHSDASLLSPFRPHLHPLVRTGHLSGKIRFNQVSLYMQSKVQELAQNGCLSVMVRHSRRLSWGLGCGVSCARSPSDMRASSSASSARPIKPRRFRSGRSLPYRCQCRRWGTRYTSSKRAGCGRDRGSAKIGGGSPEILCPSAQARSVFGRSPRPCVIRDRWVSLLGGPSRVRHRTPRSHGLCAAQRPHDAPPLGRGA